jgi:dinuclear metal center YbgI/SA1388 family protein
MGRARTAEVAAYLDQYLRAAEVPDAPGAYNGLQVENSGEIHRIAAAVDASQGAIDEAVRRGCDLLLVHHGLLWDAGPIAGRRYRRLRALLAGDVAVYSSHIPLDLHPEVGNNVLLAKALGIEVDGGFGDYRGVQIGCMGRLEIRREALTARLDDLLGTRIRLLPGGPERIRTVAVVTGAGSGNIGEAVAAGLDAFITGEGSHHTYFDAVEGGINVYYGGHYATETWGVRALAEHVAARFGLPWEFLDQPTGL